MAIVNVRVWAENWQMVFCFFYKAEVPQNAEVNKVKEIVLAI